MPTISVTKCHGTGNDFILLDARVGPQLPYAQVAKTLCPRRFAIGADGLLVLDAAQDPLAAAAMRIFNPDGSEAEMCGNGVRCIARYLYEENPEATESVIETAAGNVKTTIVTWDGKPGVRVAMAVPDFSGDVDAHDHSVTVAGEQLRPYAVSIGNPHVVLFTSRDPFAYDLDATAGAIASLNIFPRGTNVELARIYGNEILMRIHERGVGETWACGTGACAAAAAGVALGHLTTPVVVTTRGGKVKVEWDGPGQPALLTGNAELLFRTEVDVPAATAAAVGGAH